MTVTILIAIAETGLGSFFSSRIHPDLLLLQSPSVPAESNYF